MTNEAGSSVLPSAVPIILFALLLFVLLALAGVILLSLALRYRAGTARRQARRWVASLNVMDDQLLGRFLSLVHVAAFLLARISLWICADWYVFWRHSRFARFSVDSLGKPG